MENGGHLARINIDDEFWDRVGLVIAKLRDQDQAIGQALRFIRVAQTRYKQGRIVSNDDWLMYEFNEALLPAFAVRVDGGYKLVDDATHFSWLRTNSENGKIGGSVKSEAKRSAAQAREKLKRELKEKQLLSTSETTKAQTSPSFSPSCSKEDLLKNEDLNNSITTVLEPNAVSRGTLRKFADEMELFNAIPPAQLDRWRAAYEQEFLKKEFRNAFGWYENNPRKMPKNLRGWINALNSWFSRGYVRYQQGIASNPAKSKTASEIAREYEEQQRQRREFGD